MQKQNQIVLQKLRAHMTQEIKRRRRKIKLKRSGKVMKYSMGLFPMVRVLRVMEWHLKQCVKGSREQMKLLLHQTTFFLFRICPMKHRAGCFRCCSNSTQGSRKYV